MLTSVVKIQNWQCFNDGLFFGAAIFGLTEFNFLLKLCSLSLLVQKPIYSLKRRFLWCGKFHVVSVTLLKVRIVRLAFQKRFLVL